MQRYISVKVISLQELFSGAYQFRLPFFQRAYAWQTAEAGRLLSNIIEAMGSPEAPHAYFLGKLMLAKKNGSADTAIVDGHQRIMSLTILFAVLRDLEGDKAARARIHELIAGPGYRLTPQENLAAFCDRYVQSEGATSVEPEEDISALSETERNIAENRNHLRHELNERDVTPEFRRALFAFLAEKCCVIACSVEDEEEAWRILQIEEETRVNFNATDRAKSSLLSILAAGERPQCQRIWEEAELLLGSKDLYALLHHLRLLKLRKCSEKPVEIDLAQSFRLNEPGAGPAFLEQELAPAAQRFDAIRRGEIGGKRDRAAIARSIEHLAWIDDQLWVPAALLWLARRGEDAETLRFFKALERLVWMMRIAGHDPTKRSRRIVHLLAEIDRGSKVEAMRELEIGRAIRDNATLNLRSKSFDAKPYNAQVLRRISVQLGPDPGPIHPERLTIEHILPRGWAKKSDWRRHFPNEDVVRKYAHRLGNLTFLTAAENRAADTLEWSEKRRILGRAKLALSNRLAATVDWTPEAIMNRTEDLIRILFDAWDLKL